MSGADEGRSAFETLLAGNADYIAQKSPSSTDPAIREDLATNGQHPIAAVIACADSRVAPEIIFNVGVGTVFVIRNAGNVAWSDAVLGSLEYAVMHLNVPLVIVLGHSNCGAIGAAVGNVKAGGGSDGSALGDHVVRLAEVVEGVVKGDPGSATVIADSVEENVSYAVRSLQKGDDGVGSAFREGNIAIVGAVYDIHSGKVAAI